MCNLENIQQVIVYLVPPGWGGGLDRGGPLATLSFWHKEREKGDIQTKSVLCFQDEGLYHWWGLGV